MLSPAQNYAATTPGHVLIVACPGSGKTTVLKFRAEHLLKKHSGTRLAAVTFTKDAADSLRDRIRAQFPQAGKRVEAGTFHSLCMAQLRANGRRVNVAKTGQIFRLIAAAISDCPHDRGELKLEDFQAQIETWQREVNPVIPPAEQTAQAWVYRDFSARKQQLGMMDFGDLLREAVLGMKAGKVKPLAVNFMLVDEFQDTDEMQLEWVLEHARAGIEVTIVGDDDQSIYGFRGSLGYGGMMNFSNATNATLVNLDRTYRCTQNVFAPAAVLIQHNAARVQKALQTANQDHGSVTVRAFETRMAEAVEVISHIGRHLDTGTWAILARTNAQLEMVEARIGETFPYLRKKGESFWDLKAPGILLSLASSVVRGDMVGVSELLTLGGMPRNVMDDLSRQYALDMPGSLSRFVKERLPRCSPTNREFLTALQGDLSQWQRMVHSNRTREIRLAVSGMASSILKNGGWRTGQMEETQTRLEDAARALSASQKPLGHRINSVSQPRDDPAGEGVALLTLHASKGLEYDNVWIIGCEAGILPSVRDGASEEEERRLTYVGMTRAKTSLIMSYSLDKGRSKFLEESGLAGGGIFSAQRN